MCPWAGYSRPHLPCVPATQGEQQLAGDRRGLGGPLAWCGEHVGGSMGWEACQWESGSRNGETLSEASQLAPRPFQPGVVTPQWGRGCPPG